MPSLLQLLLLQSLLLLAKVSSFSPAPLGLGALFFKPAGIKTRPCLGQEVDIVKAADFFTDAFWYVLVSLTVLTTLLYCIRK